MLTAKLLVPGGTPLQLSAGERLPPLQPKPFNTCSLAMVAPSLRSGLVKVMLCAFAVLAPSRLRPSEPHTIGFVIGNPSLSIDAGIIALRPLIPAMAIFGMARKLGTRYAKGQGEAVKHSWGGNIL